MEPDCFLMEDAEKAFEIWLASLPNRRIYRAIDIEWIRFGWMALWINMAEEIRDMQNQISDQGLLIALLRTELTDKAA